MILGERVQLFLEAAGRIVPVLIDYHDDNRFRAKNPEIKQVNGWLIR